MKPWTHLALLLPVVGMTLLANHVLVAATTTSSSFTVMISLIGKVPFNVTQHDMELLQDVALEAFSLTEDYAFDNQEMNVYCKRQVDSVIITDYTYDATDKNTTTTTTNANLHSSIRFIVQVTTNNPQDSCEINESRLLAKDTENGADHFIQTFNELIHQGMLIPYIEAATQVTELQEVPCSDDVNFTQTSVLVNFIGSPDEATSQQLDAVAQGFQDTYNTLNGPTNTTCDLYFRQVTNVTIQMDTTRQRRMQGLSNFNASRFDFFSFLFRVVFQCRGCPQGTSLFANDASRRILKSKRQLQPQLSATSSTDESCYCPLDAEEFRGPTEAEFTSALNDTVSDLASEGQVNFIAGVAETIEVEPVECAPEVTDQSTQVGINVTGNPDALSDQDVNALQEAFVKAYNDLADNMCDSLFRTVINATLVTTSSENNSPSRTRRGLRTSRSLPQATTKTTPFSFPFSLYFNIVFKCRLCPTGTGLFTNDAGRFLEELGLDDSASLTPYRHRRLEDDNVCYCETDASDTSAPSADSFVYAFNDTITQLQVSSISSVDALDPDPVIPGTTESQICYLGTASDEIFCVCREGYSGARCEQQVDECAVEHQCNFTGGYCVDRFPNEGRYACGCRTRDGYTNGTVFDEHGVTSCVDLNPCRSDNPCHSKATCSFENPGFSCSCNGDLVGDGITSCVETREVACPDDINLEQTNIVVDFIGSPDEATPQELEALAQGFQDTYNILNGLFSPQFCDLYFRQVINVTIQVDASTRQRYLQAGGSGNGKPLQKFNTSIFSFFFTIVFQCRGCPKGTGLFTNDASRRRRIMTDRIPISRRLQAQGSTSSSLDTSCFCPLEAEENRGPTKSEFTSAFNDTVSDLAAQGEVTFIAAVTDSAQINNTDTSDTDRGVQATCATGKPCQPNSWCDTSRATPACICKPGYFSPSGVGGACQDSNECENGNNCHKNANCFNTPGSFSCKCKDGYEDISSPDPPGTSCQEKDECLSVQDNNCDPGTEVCINRPPPEYYLCVEKTPAPTRAPTPAPTPAKTPKPSQPATDDDDCTESSNCTGAAQCDSGICVCLSPNVFINGTCALDVVQQDTGITVISVIDENDSNSLASMQQKWNSFRSNFPDRRMCVLWPKNPNYSCKDARECLEFPPATASDENSAFDDINDPLIIVARVERQDDADTSNNISDWYTLCKVGEAKQQGGYTNVALFIDNSGSLTVNDVNESRDQFITTALNNGINILGGVVNTNEDWIGPHDRNYFCPDETASLCLAGEGCVNKVCKTPCTSSSSCITGIGEQCVDSYCSVVLPHARPP